MSLHHSPRAVCLKPHAQVAHPLVRFHPPQRHHHPVAEQGDPVARLPGLPNLHDVGLGGLEVDAKESEEPVNRVQQTLRLGEGAPHEQQIVREGEHAQFCQGQLAVSLGLKRESCVHARASPAQQDVHPHQELDGGAALAHADPALHLEGLRETGVGGELAGAQLPIAPALCLHPELCSFNAEAQATQGPLDGPVWHALESLLDVGRHDKQRPLAAPVRGDDGVDGGRHIRCTPAPQKA